MGAILPYAIFIPWFLDHGFALRLLVSQAFANRPATIFAIDALYAAAVFLLFAFVEGRRVGVRPLWLPPLLVAFVGICCALPAFLAQRERALAHGR